MFPTIYNLSEILPYINDMEEIRAKTEIIDDVEVTIICYMIADSDTFNNEWTRECRGITFMNGKVVVRPFEKFFNYKENETVSEHVLKDKVIIQQADKLDGSMISFLNVNGKYHAKTKKSFYSDVAVKASAFAQTQDNLIRFLKYVDSFNATAIFEYTAPSNKIVLDYDKEQLTLLAVRQNVSGEYLNMFDIACEIFGVPVVNHISNVHKKIEQLNNETFSEINKEGYVVQFEDGQRVKLKTKWYLDRHHIMTVVRERDVALMVVEETIDDLKTNMKDVNVNFEKVAEIEQRVKQTFVDILNEVDKLIVGYTIENVRDFAITNKNHLLFSLAVAKLRGQDIRLKEHFLKYHWKQEYSLDTLSDFNKQQVAE